MFLVKISEQNLPFLFIVVSDCCVVGGCDDDWSDGSVVSGIDPSKDFCISTLQSGNSPIESKGHIGRPTGLLHFGNVSEYPGGQGGMKQLGNVPINGRLHFSGFTNLQSGNVPVYPTSIKIVKLLQLVSSTTVGNDRFLSEPTHLTFFRRWH